MIKHTHMITIELPDYRDSFFFTPAPGEDAQAAADARVCAERRVEPGHFKVTVQQLPSAADTRARGTLVEEPATPARPFPRRYYQVPHPGAPVVIDGVDFAPVPLANALRRTARAGQPASSVTVLPLATRGTGAHGLAALDSIAKVGRGRQ